MSDFIQLQSEPIDIAAIHAALSNPAHGAQLLFTGVVRDRNEGRKVNSIQYEAYEPLAQRVLEDLASEVRNRISPDLSVVLIHRFGTLGVGEISTVVGVSSPHRKEAYDASRYLIEALKERLPVWKEEAYLSGEKNWLDGKPLNT